MRLNPLVLLLFSFILSLNVSAQSGADGPEVVQAYSAIYPDVAAAVRASGGVVVEVKIDSRGMVTSTRILEGIPLLGSAAEKSARRWVFAPEAKQKERTARLTFIFKIMPYDTPADELVTIFKPPYQIEVRRALPKLVDSPNVDTPFPLKKKPYKEKGMSIYHDFGTCRPFS